MFLYNAATQTFEDPDTYFMNKILNDDEILNHFTKGLSEDRVKHQKKFFGKNKIISSIKPLWYFIVKDFTKAITLIEFIQVIIFYLNGNYIFASIILTIIIIMNFKEALYRMHSEKKSKHLYGKRPVVTVLRNDGNLMYQKKINYSKVVPGDLIVLEPDVMYIMDMLLLKGEILVDESKVRGTTDFISKVGYYNDQKKVGNAFILSESICTEVLAPAQALVLSTGWNTRRGKYLLDVKYQPKKYYSYYKELYLWIIVMMVIFSIVSTVMVITIAGHLSKTVIFYEVLLLLVVYVNPVLLISFNMGIHYTSEHLEKNNVYTKEPEKLNLVSNLKYLCIDKTGTMTFPENELVGFLPKEGFAKKGQLPVQSKEAFEQNKELVEILACCSNIRMKEGEVKGMDMDLECFKASKFQISPENLNKRVPSESYIKAFGP